MWHCGEDGKEKLKKQSGLKEDFACIPVEVPPEKHRGRPRQPHALCGKKAGEESH